MNEGAAFSSDVAISACTRLIQSSNATREDLATAHTKRGNAHYDKGEPDLAIADYTKAIELDPKDAQPYFNRGLAYVKKREPDPAIADFTNAIELDPNYADAYIARGNVYDDTGEHDQAIASYTKAIQLKPNYALAYYNRSIAYRDKGDADRAIADYNKAIELNSNSQLSPDWAQCVDQGSAFAISACTRIIQSGTKTRENLAAAYTDRGIAYEHEGEHKQAIADYTNAIELDPKLAAAYYSRGNVYEREGEHDQAIADYNKAIDLDPKYADAYHNRGAAYRNKGDADRAIVDFNKTLELNPNDAGAYDDRGIASFDKGDVDRAMADYKRAIELDPNLAGAYNNRGIAYDDKGEHDQAIADFTKAIELDPKLAGAYNNRGLAYERKTELDRAMSDYEKALDIGEKVLSPDDPNMGTFRGNLGALYKSKGELDKAAPLLKRALEIKEKAFGPNSPLLADPLTQLGELLRLEDKCTEAELLFQQAYDLGKTEFEEVPVLFATDRKRDAGRPSVAFGSELGEETTFGRVIVTVPNPRIAKAAWLGGGRSDPTKTTDAQHLALHCIEADLNDAQLMFEGVFGRLGAIAHRNPSQALVFVHGYNVSFENAVRRAAQLAYDTKFAGGVFLFSWPSKEDVWDYPADSKTADLAVPHLKHFLEKIVGEMGVTKIHFIAHSMGNKLLLRSLAQIVEKDPDLRPRIGEIIDAAPDVDADEFAQLVDKIKTGGAKFTLYAAETDKALWLSGALRHRPRAGFINGKPLIVRDEAGKEVIADTIDITNGGKGAWYDLFALNHDLYSSNPIIVGDMKRIIEQSERPPDKRTKEFEEVRSAERTYWRLRSPRGAAQ